MSEDYTFTLRGHAHDIPMVLGLVVIGWNACEQALKDILTSLSIRNTPENRQLVSVIIAELGTLGVVQALQCLADEFPDDAKELADELRYLTKLSEALKARRNYYVHGVRGVTGYGVFVDEVPLDQLERPYNEFLVEGPFANIHQTTAKGAAKLHYDFIKAGEIANLSNRLDALLEYSRSVGSTLNHYLRGLDWREISPLPQRPPMPDKLVKRAVPHRKQLLRRALTPNPRPELEDDTPEE